MVKKAARTKGGNWNCQVRIQSARFSEFLLKQGKLLPIDRLVVQRFLGAQNRGSIASNGAHALKRTTVDVTASLDAGHSVAWRRTARCIRTRRLRVVACRESRPGDACHRRRIQR